MNSEPDIVIVGAGAAGVGAARRLVGCGLSISVLEVLPRTGGRAWTLKTSPRSRRSGLRLAPFGRPQSLDAHRRKHRIRGGSRSDRLGRAIPRSRFLTGGTGGGRNSLWTLDGSDQHGAAGKRPGVGCAGSRQSLVCLSSGIERIHQRRRTRAHLSGRLRGL